MKIKQIGKIQGIISMRRLVSNPTIQHVTINLFTKYDFVSLQGCGETFNEKVLRNYGRTDGGTDGGMDRCKPVYICPSFRPFQGGTSVVVQQCDILCLYVYDLQQYGQLNNSCS